MNPIDYWLLVRREASEATKQKTPFKYNHATLGNLRDAPDMRGPENNVARQIPDTTKRRILRQEFLNGKPELKPRCIEDEEHLVVIPRIQVGENTKRSGKAVYNDMFTIPRRIRRVHNQEVRQHDD